MPSGEASVSAGRHNLVTALILAVVLLIIVGAVSATTVHAHNNRKHHAAAPPVSRPRTTPAPAAGRPSTELEKIYQATIAARTASYTISSTFTRSGDAGSITASGKDSFDRRDASISQSLTLNGKTTATQALYVGAQNYESVPAALQATESAGKPWVSYSGLPRLQTSTYPTDSIVLLEADAIGVQRVGPSEVDGVPTTEYRATIPSAQEPAYSSLLNGELKEFSSEFQDADIALAVWADSENRVREVRLVLQGPADHETLTTDLSQFGLPVDVTAPPAAQVDVRSAPTP